MKPAAVGKGTGHEPLRASSQQHAGVPLPHLRRVRNTAGDYSDAGHSLFAAGLAEVLQLHDAVGDGE